MRVGLSLLTLVPGISGGSETYARELCRALVRVGSERYEALVPTLAPEAGGGSRPSSRPATRRRPGSRAGSAPWRGRRCAPARSESV